jgi:shikimate kinase
VEELFQEREQLYRRYASLSVQTSGITPAESANYVLEKLAAYNQHKPRGCFSYDS